MEQTKSTHEAICPVSKKNWWKSPSISVNWKAVRRLVVAFSLAYLVVQLQTHYPGDEVARCYQTPPLAPSRNLEIWEALNQKVETERFQHDAIESLRDAVRIRTKSFDNLGDVGTDNRWNVFTDFRSFLENTFPLVHSNLDMTLVNSHGLFYQWQGTNPNLKPILLAAHQDVVPVENSTLDRWSHPPFEGHYDGQRIWGRGSSDDKSQLVSILWSVESLIDKGFRPTRTVLLAFGFDEEASGFHGAQYLAEHIKSVYGHNGIAVIVDEGAGFYNISGAVLAIPGVTEKGLYNVRVEVNGPGGHSSMPPAHTTIGILAELLHELESAPEPLSISGSHPMSSIAQCLIPNIKIGIWQPLLRIPTLLLRFQLFRDAIAWWFRDVLVLRSLVPTTRAIDMIHGGLKFNALPESVWAVVNHRVSVTSSLKAVQDRYEKILKPLVQRYGMSFEAFGNQITEGPSLFSLLVSNATLHSVEPAPFSPSGPNDLPYKLLSGTIKSTYNAHRHLEAAGSEITVAPGMMTGNTDTRYYWAVSRHIFRYNHHYGGTRPDPSANGIHTTNEFIEADVLLESIRFFITLILNGDENEL